MRIQKIQTNLYQQQTAFKSNVLAEVRFRFDQKIDVFPLEGKVLTEAISRGFIDLATCINSPLTYKAETMELDNVSARFLVLDAKAHSGDIKNLSGELTEDGKNIKWDIEAHPIGL